VSLQVILIGSSSVAVLAASSDPPSSCGFGIHLHLKGDYFDGFAGGYLGHVQGDYIHPDKRYVPKQAKYFPNAHIQNGLGEGDKWLTLGCEFCSDAAQKEAAMGKWAIWKPRSLPGTDVLPTDAPGGAKLLGTCENCPAAGGVLPWSPKATWTAYGNATQSYKGSTTCCQQACLDPNVCKLDWGALKCFATDCCLWNLALGCRYVGKQPICAPAKGEGLHVMQTNLTIV
jgi:cytochrome c5